MKKIFIAILALTAVAACNKAEVIDVNPGTPISFGNPFVDNSTKVIDNTYTSENLPGAFKVYGTLSNGTETVNIFNAVEVTKTQNNPTDISGTNTWYYAADKVQYWMEGNTYNFAAVVGGTVTPDDNGMPATIAYTVADQFDLLYAVDNHGEHTSASATNVAFELGHLLSKVKFTFTNEYPAEANFVIKIDDVAILNAAKSGVYDVDATTKWSSTEDLSLSFGPVVAAGATEATVGVYMENGTTGYASNYARLLVPEEQGWQIKFLANVYYHNGSSYTLVNKFDYRTTPLATESLALEAGKSYNFNIAIGGELNPITFSATTADWKDETTAPIALQ